MGELNVTTNEEDEVMDKNYKFPLNTTGQYMHLRLNLPIILI